MENMRLDQQSDLGKSDIKLLAYKKYLGTSRLYLKQSKNWHHDVSAF